MTSSSSLRNPEEFILDRFHVDAVDIGRAFNTDDAAWQPTTLADGQPAWYPAWFQPERQTDGSIVARMKDGLAIARMPARGTFFDQTYFPYIDDYPADYRDLSTEMGRILWAALVHSPWDHAGDPGFWETLRAKALELRRTSDRALMIVIGCNLFEWGTFLRRMDNFLMDLVAEPEQVERLLDALMERHLAVLEKACLAVGDVADIIRFGDDLGANDGPFMSPNTYRNYSSRATRSCATMSTNTPNEDVSALVRLDSRLVAGLDRSRLRRDQSGADHCRGMEAEG